MLHPDTKKMLENSAAAYGLTFAEVCQEWTGFQVHEGKLQDGRPVTFEGWLKAKKNSLSFGYDPEDLEKIFKACANPDDWKDAIFVEVSGELVLITVAAIRFYTATDPRVSLNPDTMRYLIQSEGYRMGPAGDH